VSQNLAYVSCNNRLSRSQSAPPPDEDTFTVRVHGLISKFSVASGRAGTDRQFLYVNGRPCTLNKV
jgi:DNA mismatch repair protein PMS2